MFYRGERIALLFATLVASSIVANCAFAQVACSDLKYGAPNYQEKMTELARQAQLPDNYWNRYHESVVSDLCSGDMKDVDKLVDEGLVAPQEAAGIGRVLGITYKAKPRSAAGKRYRYLREKFSQMGACGSCADNIAQYYIKQPGSPCGKLAKQALGGDPEATKELVDFPDYCQWKY
ncbi:MAG TPA: hypothetical protein VK437_15700 [Steroidobacteraceae bacterium]|nr:hypothetical protein [Steroidobacteraceae bacterium]